MLAACVPESTAISSALIRVDGDWARSDAMPISDRNRTKEFILISTNAVVVELRRAEEKWVESIFSQIFT
jgi:hypothetical protein